MDVRDIVVSHYAGTALADRILGALAGAGIDIDHLTVEDLAPIDQLHAGFVGATEHVLDLVADQEGTRLLDVGCGIGGPARLAATRLATRGGHVTGVDLSPDFVEAARMLTDRVGLADTASYEMTDGDGLPVGDASYDAAMMIHVGMNVPDKEQLFREVHRALVPGGRFVVYDQMRSGNGDLPYPLPWADDARSSFVERSAEYVAHLEAAGFTVGDIQDRTQAVAGPPPAGPLGSAGPGVVFGPGFPERIGNNIAATIAGDLAAVVIVAHAT